MKRSIYKPQHPLLSQAVSCIGQIELTPDDSHDGWFGLLPNGSSNLTISLNEEPVTYFNESSTCLIYASWSSPAAIKRTESLKFLNVMFKPHGLHLISGIPGQEYQNQTLSASSLFTQSEIDQLRECLFELSDQAHRYTLIEQYLVARIRSRLIDERLEVALKLLKDPVIDLKEVSEKVCLSPRRLRELLTTYTGFSPAFFRKISRFNCAAKAVEGDSLTQVALANGYYDQSHFIRDFKFFSGITPSEYLMKKSRPAEFYNFDLADLTDFKQAVS